MSKGINIIKKNRVKTNILNGDSYKQAMIKAGYSINTAINATKKKVVKDCQEEIAMEIDKRDLVNKAYKTLQNNLSADKASDRNTAAIALLDFNEGKKSNVKNENINPDKIIIAYGNKENTPTEKNRITDEVKEEGKLT